MKKFKIIFADNKPVSATQLEDGMPATYKITNGVHGKVIEWFVVHANNEQDAIRVMNIVLTEDIEKILRMDAIGKTEKNIHVTHQAA